MSDAARRRWQRIDTLLDRLMDAAPEERRHILADLPGEDADLRAEIEALLDAANREDGILDRSVGEAFSTLLEEAFEEPEPRGVPAPPEQVGPWRVLREIGRGGMGVVYLAERATGDFEQRVALKLLKRGLDTDEIVARFARERKILARLEHPAIARLIDGGVSDDGRPYLTMEYVEGVPITEYCARERLELRDTLLLFRRVCEAVHLAHRKLVAHRDLKPSNILVTADGELKLLDFGIAKLLGGEEDEDAQTLTRLRGPMTPAYAAPEQLRGEPTSTATDVYALGMILFELLVGRPPRRAPPAGRHEARAEEPYDSEPLRPSEGLRMDDGRARNDVPDDSSASVRRRVAGDLDAIVATALRSEPDRRYPSAEALAEDLRRYLADEPVWARPDGAAYRARKFVRRHRIGVSAAALLLAVLTAAVAMIYSQSQARAQEARKAEEVKEFVLGLFAAADPAVARGEEVTARQLVDAGAQRVSQELAQQPAVRAEMETVLGELYRMLGASNQALSLLDRAIASYETAAGNVDAGLANALRAKGATLSDQGELEEAEALLRKAVAIHRRALGPADLEVAEDLDWLGLVLRQQGAFEDSEAALRDSLGIRQSALGDDHEKVAASLNNLAVLRRERGAYGEAEALYRRALDIRLATLGKVHTDTADTLNNLAALLYFQGRWAEARERFTEVAAIYTHLYGESHPRAVMAQNNIAAVALALGLNEEAERRFEAVLAAWRASGGESHPNALLSRSNLALIEAEVGDIRAAEAVFRELVASAQETLGDKHPVTALLAARLAGVLRQCARHDEAVALYMQSLAVTRELRGEDNPTYAQGLHDLGVAQRDSDDLESAERSLQQAFDLRVRLLGAEHPDTLSSQMALGAILSARGDAGRGERLLSSGLATTRQILAEDHPLVLRGAFDLAKSSQRSAGAVEAMRHIEALIPSYRRRYGEPHWRTAEVELARAALLAAGGRRDEARAGASRAHAALAKALGPDHDLTRRAEALAAQ